MMVKGLNSTARNSVDSLGCQNIIQDVEVRTWCGQAVHFARAYPFIDRCPGNPTMEEQQCMLDLWKICFCQANVAINSLL